MGRIVKVYLEPRRKMRDKEGRLWEGMNSQAAKPNKFRKIKTIEVRDDLPKHLIERTERHEYAEQQLMRRKHLSYKSAHKRALKLERKPIPGIKFVNIKAK